MFRQERIPDGAGKNKDFVARAPAEVVEAEKAKLIKTEELIEKLNKNLESLAGW
jgi:valyl-tRNA synthetase